MGRISIEATTSEDLKEIGKKRDHNMPKDYKQPERSKDEHKQMPVEKHDSGYF